MPRPKSKSMAPAITRIQTGNPVKGSWLAVAVATRPLTPLATDTAGAAPPPEESDVVVVPRTVVVVVELVLGVVVDVLGVVVVVVDVDVAQSSFPGSPSLPAATPQPRGVVVVVSGVVVVVVDVVQSSVHSGVVVVVLVVSGVVVVVVDVVQSPGLWFSRQSPPSHGCENVHSGVVVVVVDVDVEVDVDVDVEVEVERVLVVPRQ
jgi:hypothetical protein